MTNNLPDNAALTDEMPDPNWENHFYAEFKNGAYVATWNADVFELQRKGEGARPDKWQPIETAPINSVDVLVCLNNDHGEIMIARTPGTGKWWSRNMVQIPTPTHWQPLPAAPEPAMCPNCVTPWKCNGPHETTTNQAEEA